MRKAPAKHRATIRRVGEHNKPIPHTQDLQNELDLKYKEGDQVTLTLKRYHKRRTTGKHKGTPDEESNQNGYLWTVVLPYLCEYFGYLPYDMLDALRPLFFFEVSDKDPNIKRLKSTSEYNTKEWEEKMEEIRVWALTEHDIKIPEPNEVDLD
jgi:hypothetical protein